MPPRSRSLYLFRVPQTSGCVTVTSHLVTSLRLRGRPGSAGYQRSEGSVTKDDRRAELSQTRDTRVTADEDTRRTIYDSTPLRLADAPAEQ